MSEKIVPVGSRVLVVPDEVLPESDVIHLPDTAAEDRAMSGVIVARGNMVGSEFRIGQRVTFNEYAGMTYEVDGERQIVMSLDEIQLLIGSPETDETVAHG